MSGTAGTSGSGDHPSGGEPPLLECVNCGQKFDPKKNTRYACQYHPSNYGLMGKVARGIGYACCCRTNKDDPGCRFGRHSTEFTAGQRLLRQELDKYLHDSNEAEPTHTSSTEGGGSSPDAGVGVLMRRRSIPNISKVSTQHHYLLRVTVEDNLEKFALNTFIASVAKCLGVEEKNIVIISITGERHALIAMIFIDLPNEKEVVEFFKFSVDGSSPELASLQILSCHITPPTANAATSGESPRKDSLGGGGGVLTPLSRKDSSGPTPLARKESGTSTSSANFDSNAKRPSLPPSDPKRRQSTTGNSTTTPTALPMFSGETPAQRRASGFSLHYGSSFSYKPGDRKQSTAE